MTAICLPIDAVSGAPAFPAAQNRVAFGALMLGRTDRPLGAVSGVRPGSDPAVTVNAGTMQYTVTPFAAVIDPGTALTVGAYLVAFTANVTGAINAADAVSTRIDRLDVQVPDDPAGGDPLAPVIVYTAGVPGGGVAAAAPARSVPLAQITVPASGGGNPSVTKTFGYAVASGGVLPVSGAAAYPSHPFVGQHVDDAQLGLMRWNGTAWAPVKAGGFAQLTATSGAQAVAQSTSVTINKGLNVDYTSVDVVAAGGTVGTITVEQAGDYEIAGAVALDGVNGGRHDCNIYVNGVSMFGGHVTGSPSGSSVVSAGPKRLPLNAGDVVTLVTWTSVTGATVDNGGSTYLLVKRVG